MWLRVGKSFPGAGRVSRAFSQKKFVVATFRHRAWAVETWVRVSPQYLCIYTVYSSLSKCFALSNPLGDLPSLLESLGWCFVFGPRRVALMIPQCLAPHTFKLLQQPFFWSVQKRKQYNGDMQINFYFKHNNRNCLIPWGRKNNFPSTFLGSSLRILPTPL